jgi:hypothetical protein
MNEYKVVTVRKDDLQAYMTDYHHRNQSDICKADGQPWPCDIWVRLWRAHSEQ